MKRLTLKRTQMSAVLVLGVVLMLGYQNCSTQMAFDGSNLGPGGKLAVVPDEPQDDIGDDPINPGDGSPGGLPPGTLPPVAGNPPGTTPPGTMPPGSTPPPTMPPGTTPPKHDVDTDIDYDYEGKKVAFQCATGAEVDLNEAELLKAGDLRLRNVHRLMANYTRPLRYVDAAGIHSAIYIKNAFRIDKLTDVHGLWSVVRAVEVEKVDNIHVAASSTAAIKLKSLDNVHAAFVCASGQEIGKISNLHTFYTKFRGRSKTDAVGQVKINGTAEEISDFHPTFASIYQLDVKKIRNIHGELIIRDSKIDSIDDFHGGLTLINSTVRELRNSHGKLRLRNSTVDSEIDVKMERITLPKK